jgi:hypothetical protein
MGGSEPSGESERLLGELPLPPDRAVVKHPVLVT